VTKGPNHLPLKVVQVGRKNGGSRVEAPSQGISRPEVGLETIFSTDDESEEERELVSTTSLRHRNQRNKGLAVSVETEALEEPAIVEEFAAAEEPTAMEETERVEIDDPPQLKVASASLMIPRENEDATGQPDYWASWRQNPYYRSFPDSSIIFIIRRAC